MHSSRLPTNGGKTKNTLWRSYERIDEIHAIPSESQALNEGQHIFEHLLELLYHLLVVQCTSLVRNAIFQCNTTAESERR